MKFLREFFISIQNSLVNPPYYLTVKDESFWATLKYLFSLLTLISLVYCLFFAISLIPLVPQAPVVNIKDGLLSTNVPQPYFYKNLFAIDTAATKNDYQKYQNRAPVLITKDAVISPDNVFYFRDLNQPVTTANLQTWLVGAIIIIFLLGPFFLSGLLLSEKLTSLAIFSLLAFVIIKLLKKKLTYQQIYKISSHASTLPILFFSLLGFLGLSPTIPFGYSLLLALVVTVILHRVWTKIS